MTDLRTPQQKKRESRAKKVIAMYSRLSGSGNSITAIIDHIANKLSESQENLITPMGVRYILKRENLI